jgi:serine/threonine-protein kinase
MSDTGRPEDRIGTVVSGRYRIDRLAGKGGMGSVFEATQLSLDRKVALKLLLPRLVDSERARKRFQREATAAAKAARRGVVEVYDFDFDPQAGPFLVMEFLDGDPLSTRLRRQGFLSPAEAIAVGLDVLETLAFVHDQGLVHRDLKPGNLFLVPQEGGTTSVKLLDFGLVRLVRSEFHTQITRPGALLGTPNYMPPEQARGQRDVDHRADLYAVGAILYHALAGKRPFTGSPVEILAALISGPPEPLESVRPEIPAPLCGFVEQAMQRDRDHRFQDARGMRRALLDAADRCGIRPRPPAATPPTPGSVLPDAPARDPRPTVPGLPTAPAASESPPPTPAPAEPGTPAVTVVVVPPPLVAEPPTLRGMPLRGGTVTPPKPDTATPGEHHAQHREPLEPDPERAGSTSEALAQAPAPAPDLHPSSIDRTFEPTEIAARRRWALPAALTTLVALAVLFFALRNAPMDAPTTPAENEGEDEATADGTDEPRGHEATEETSTAAAPPPIEDRPTQTDPYLETPALEAGAAPETDAAVEPPDAAAGAQDSDGRNDGRRNDGGATPETTTHADAARDAGGSAAGPDADAGTPPIADAAPAEPVDTSAAADTSLADSAPTSPGPDAGTPPIADADTAVADTADAAPPNQPFDAPLPESSGSDDASSPAEAARPPPLIDAGRDDGRPRVPALPR